MEFDSRAREWDKDPVKIERAKKFAREVKHVIETGSKESLTALEFGCGTGQVSFFLKDIFREIHLIDTSEGMLEVLHEMIRNHQIHNMFPRLRDILHDGLGMENPDVIYTLMSLHHIEELQKVLKLFTDNLSANGYLIIGDLVKEDGSFHDHAPDFKGHNGFSRQQLLEMLEPAGLKEVVYKEFFSITKKYENGTTKDFPLFFMALQKIK